MELGYAYVESHRGAMAQLKDLGNSDLADMRDLRYPEIDLVYRHGPATELQLDFLRSKALTSRNNLSCSEASELIRECVHKDLEPEIWIALNGHRKVGVSPA